MDKGRAKNGVAFVWARKRSRPLSNARTSFTISSQVERSRIRHWVLRLLIKDVPRSPVLVEICVSTVRSFVPTSLPIVLCRVARHFSSCRVFAFFAMSSSGALADMLQAQWSVSGSSSGPPAGQSGKLEAMGGGPSGSPCGQSAPRGFEVFAF